jgi:hypothetical protein
MEKLCVLACAREPGDDGGLSVAEGPLGGGSIQPFGQRREDHCDLVRWGFQTVQGRVASSTERGVAGLTPKRLDPLSRAMLAIPDESMDVSSGDLEVETLTVRTGEALRVSTFGSTPTAFHLAPGPHTQRRWTRTR